MLCRRNVTACYIECSCLCASDLVGGVMATRRAAATARNPGFGFVMDCRWIWRLLNVCSSTSYRVVSRRRSGHGCPALCGLGVTQPRRLTQRLVGQLVQIGELAQVGSFQI
jgi:hypothetical protein